MSNTALKPKKYRSILLFVTACVILASLFFVRCTVIAKWISVASGSDSADVALFAVDVTSTSSGDLSIDSNNDEASYAFTVANYKDGATSEVDIAYTVMVTLPQALPEGLSMTIDGTGGTISADGLIHTFTGSDWLFTAGVTKASEHILTFAASDSLTDGIILNNILVAVEMAQAD